jgi:sulfonate transport system permease protein
MMDASLFSVLAASAADPRAYRKDRLPHASSGVVATVVADVTEGAISNDALAPWRRALLPWLMPVGLLAIWQVLSITGTISTAIVPAPSDIWNAAAS